GLQRVAIPFQGGLAKTAPPLVGVRLPGNFNESLPDRVVVSAGTAAERRPLVECPDEGLANPGALGGNACRGFCRRQRVDVDADILESLSKPRILFAAPKKILFPGNQLRRASAIVSFRFNEKQSGLQVFAWALVDLLQPPGRDQVVLQVHEARGPLPVA